MHDIEIFPIAFLQKMYFLFDIPIFHSQQKDYFRLQNYIYRKAFKRYINNDRVYHDGAGKSGGRKPTNIRYI